MLEEKKILAQFINHSEIIREHILLSLIVMCHSMDDKGLIELEEIKRNIIKFGNFIRILHSFKIKTFLSLAGMKSRNKHFKRLNFLAV